MNEQHLSAIRDRWSKVCGFPWAVLPHDAELDHENVNTTLWQCPQAELDRLASIHSAGIRASKAKGDSEDAYAKQQADTVEKINPGVTVNADSRHPVSQFVRNAASDIGSLLEEVEKLEAMFEAERRAAGKLKERAEAAESTIARIRRAAPALRDALRGLE